MTVVATVERHASERGSHAAIVSDQVTMDYRDLALAVGRCQRQLVASGISSSDVVALTVRDEPRHLVLSLALLADGAAQVTLASHDTDGIRNEIARRSRVTRTITDGDALKLVDLDSPVGGHPGRPRPAPHSAPDVQGRLYLRTSGTTGAIHVVVLTEEQLSLQARRHQDYADERLLRPASIEHNNVKRHRLYCVLAGGTNVFLPRGSLDIVTRCQRDEVTCLDIARFHAAELLKQPNARALASVKLRTGGSSVPWPIRQALLSHVTPNLFVRYGATEIGGIAMAGPQDHGPDESAGQPLAGVEVEVVDECGRSLPRGQGGQLRLRAPGMATGYLDSPEHTSRRFRRGWFYTGDVGLMRPDGALVVQGRTDDMIVFNGLNIFPSEIERVLMGHPDVRAATALGLESEIHGQIPVAVVELAAGSSVGERELAGYCREALALKAPRRIVIIDLMPISAAGKILRRDLAALFARL